MKMRFFNVLLLFTCCFFAIGALHAQMIITGTIKNKKGDPINGATITVRETTQGAVANDNGEFKIVIKTATKVTLDISSVGYASQSLIVATADAANPLKITLEEGSNNMGDVIVTGSSGRRVQQVMPMSVTSINNTKLNKIKFNSQADIFRSVPGVTAEGGGGELASNLFIRGLPSGGQYQFTPLQIDGMPVISTMGLNSSAPDVYFRNDLGIQKIDFVRGGSATMYGMGSVAGIINYTSRIGSSKPQTILETEVASPGKVRMDFNNSGALGEKLYYNVSGTYRYDDGPIVTGLSSNGYQIRANIRKELNNGSFTVYAQMIDDRVQFFLPYHLTSARKRPVGWDGKTIMTMQTADVANLTVRTPNGFYRSRAAEGVSTKGGYLMAAFEKELSSGWKIDAKFRTAKYQHQFNFFGVDGSGRNPMTQRIFLDSIAARPPQAPVNAVYSYANDGTVLNANSLVLENNMTDRDRPLSEMAGNFNLSKTFNGNKAVHTFNIGAFIARTEAGDYNVQLRYLSEFKNQPRVLNLRYTDNGVARNYTVNGVRSVAGYTNKFLISNKAALYLTDEIVWGKLRVDLGFRVESIKGTVNAE
ncbi:MAG: TonB-dependent receptor plug domain-containing protein, partial [Chitinophagaceae bacterium]